MNLGVQSSLSKPFIGKKNFENPSVKSEVTTAFQVSRTVLVSFNCWPSQRPEKKTRSAALTRVH